MRKLVSIGIAVLAVGLLCAAHYSLTSETAVSFTAPTKINRHAGFTHVALQNNGPNPEDCTYGTDPGDGGSPLYVDGGLVLGAAGVVAVGHAWSIASSGGNWPLPNGGYMDPNMNIWCLAKTATQLTGADTVLMESQ